MLSQVLGAVAAAGWVGTAAFGQLDSLNPAEDGWDGEAFERETAALFGEFRSWLTGELSEELDLFASDPLPATPMEPLVTEPASAGSFRVRRGGSSLPFLSAEDLEPAPVSRIREELCRGFAGGSPERVYVKTIETDLASPTAIRSRHLVFLAGRTGDGMCERHAGWAIEWKRSANGPRIVSLRLESWEETLDSGHDEPLFTDVTSAALEGNREVVEQLGLGTDDWRSRIENYLNIHLFGQRGLALGDVNGDLLDDVYVCQPGGLPNRLLLHRPDGRVDDGSAQFGVDLLDDSRAALFADFDNDGDQDLVITLHSGLELFENVDGQRFERRRHIPDVADGQAVVAADWDLDGDLDLYVCSYFSDSEAAGELAMPLPYFDANNGGRNVLLSNDGRWGFEDVTERVGLDVHNRRWSWAALWFDADLDGDPDLYVANDFGQDCLYRNDAGTGRRRFREVAAEAGIATGAFGMSVSAADYDGDRWPDLYVGNMFSSAGSRITRQPGFQPDAPEAVKKAYQRLAAGNSLFRFMNAADPRPVYSDASDAGGAAMGRWSWSSLFADINNDGWSDLLVANGYVTGHREEDDL